MKYKYPIFLLMIFLACNGLQTRPNPSPTQTPTSEASISNTLAPSQTFTPSNTIAPTDTLTPVSSNTPTHTPLPPTATAFPAYATKDFIFKYQSAGFPRLVGGIIDVNIPQIILYSDGQLIVAREPMLEKVLSKKEINELFSELKDMGFFTIETNQKHDETDTLYKFGEGDFQKAYMTDGRFLCITIVSNKSRHLCAYEPLQEFLIPAMRQLLKFVNHYKPKGMSPYRPDRIILDVIFGDDYLPPENRPGTIEWNGELPSLETTKWKMIYAEGKTAEKIFALFEYTEGFKIVVDNGASYTVFARPVLPHETLTQP